MSTKTKTSRTAIRVRKDGNAYVAHHPQHPTLFHCAMKRQEAINGVWAKLQDEGGVYMAIPDWHQPNEKTCPQNANAKHPCTCKRPMKRKPFRVCRVRDNTVPRGVKPEISFEVYPNGRLVFREKNRSKFYETTAGAIYERLQQQEGQRIAQLKKLLRKGNQKGRRTRRK